MRDSDGLDQGGESAYALKIKPMGLSEGLLWNVVEKEKPGMAPGIWARAPGRMQLPFTEEWKTVGEAGEAREVKGLVRDTLNVRYPLDIREEADERV